ncbi:MAG: hypothetical protein IMZ71_01655, partial [Chloroflexi bacterium]|nr:hypothetical protein [Chloroflexota bacterium]
VTREEAEAGDAFNDALADLQAATGGLSRAIAGTLIPALTKLAEGTADIIAKVRAWAIEHKGLTTALAGGTLAIGGIATAIGTLAYGIGTVISQLPKLIVGFKAISAFASKSIIFNVALTGVAVVAAGIIKMIDDFKKLKAEGQSTAEAMANQFQNFASGIVESFKGTAAMDDLRKKLDDVRLGALAFLPAGKSLLDQLGALSPFATQAAFSMTALGKALKELGVKGKTELSDELAAAEKALKDFNASSEKTPGQLKVLREKIAALKDAMSGLKTETRTLKEQFSLLEKTELEKTYTRMLAALSAYQGKLSEGGGKKLLDETIALRAELDNTKPSIIELDDVITKLFDDIDKSMMSASELAGWNDEWAAFGKTMQRDFEVSADGIVQDTLKIGGTAEQMADKFKLFGDALGVSAKTVAVEMYNIQATILRTMGILVPILETTWERFSFGTVKLAKETATAFETCADDIAKAFGEAFASIIRDGLNFGNFFKSLMQGVVNAAATYAGSELTKAFSTAFDAIKTGASSATAALGALAASVGTVLAVVAAVAMAIASVVSIFSFFLSQSKDRSAEWDAETARVNAMVEEWKRLGWTIDEINQKLTDMANIFAKWGTAPSIDALGNPIVDSTPPKNPWEQAQKDLADAMAGGVEGALSLDDAWSNLISKAKELGLEGSKAFIDLILKMRESGTTSKALTEYVLGQLDTVPNALNVLTQNMIAAQDAYIKRIPEIAAAWEALKKKNPKLTDEDFWKYLPGPNKSGKDTS